MLQVSQQFDFAQGFPCQHGRTKGLGDFLDGDQASSQTILRRAVSGQWLFIQLWRGRIPDQATRINLNRSWLDVSGMI